MAYTLVYTFGKLTSGQTMRGQIYDTSDSATGSEITTVAELGTTGFYRAVVSTIPDAHRGYIEFYASGASDTPQMAFAINPEEGEYLDQQQTTLFTTALTESYAADGAAFTLAQALYEIVQFHNERNVSSTTVTVKKRDGSTTAYTLTLNDATTPTSITRAT